MPETANRVVEPPSPKLPEGNNWRELPCPALGCWQPEQTVSVIIPYYNDKDPLKYTLRALENQSYPRELFEVIIADDGSSVPPDLDDLNDRRLDTRIVRQEDEGYRLAAVRNLGAHAARGEILVFMDSDMVPQRRAIEAHARWHHVSDYAVTIGFRIHASFEGLEREAVAKAVREGSMATLFEGRLQQRPEYLELHMERTADLTTRHTDLFRVVTGGNLGVRAETYFRAGGYDESFNRWGAEDTEFGYRLFNDGCLLVPERAAECWHQGIGSFRDTEYQRVLEVQRAKIAHLIPHPGFRSTSPGRTYSRPRALATVRVLDHPADVIAGTVEALLASSISDLYVLLDIPSTHPGLEWITHQFAPDSRVHVGSDLDPERLHPHAPVQIVVPGACRVGPRTIELILQQVGSEVGVLHITIPGRPPEEVMLLATWTRALRRGRRIDSEEAIRCAARQFGERWASGREFGIGVDAPIRRLSNRPPPASGDLAAAQQLFVRLTPAQRATLLALAERLAKALAALQKLRGPTPVRECAVAARSVGGALAPIWVRRLLYRFVYPAYRRLRRAHKSP